jgi:hypothetical protein
VIAALGSLANSAISTSGFAAYDFAPLSGIELAANTSYWIEISESTPNGIEWAWSLDTSGPGVDGTNAANPSFGVFPVDGNGAYQMAVSVPEPAMLPVLGAGLLLGLAWRHRAR